VRWEAKVNVHKRTYGSHKYSKEGTYYGEAERRDKGKERRRLREMHFTVLKRSGVCNCFVWLVNRVYLWGEVK